MNGKIASFWAATLAVLVLTTNMSAQDYLRIKSIKCIRPSTGTDAATDVLIGGLVAGAAFATGGAALGALAPGTAAAEVTLGTITVTKGLLVKSAAAAAAEAGGNGLAGMITKHYPGADDVYLKINGKKVWPLAGSIEMNSQEILNVNLIVPFENGLFVQIEEYDSASGDDHLGSVYFQSAKKTPFTSDGTLRQIVFSKDEGSCYELEFEKQNLKSEIKTQGRDFDLLVVGADGNIYRKNGLLGKFTRVANSGNAKSVAALGDGTIVVVGTDSFLYSSVKLGAGFARVANSGNAKSVAALGNGTIVVVGTDGFLYSSAKLGAGFARVANSGSAVSVSAKRDGTIVVVGTDGFLYSTPKLGGGFSRILNSGNARSIAVMPDDSFVVTGSDQRLYTTNKKINEGRSVVQNSGNANGVTRLKNGTIVVVGTDGFLYSSPTVGAGFARVANSGNAKSVAALGDGTIVVVGTDGFLYSSAKLGAGFARVANSGNCTTVMVTATKDGKETIRVVGTDRHIYRADKLGGGFTREPLSANYFDAVDWVDGRVMVLENDRRLCMRNSLEKEDWRQIPSSGTWSWSYGGNCIDVCAIPK